MMKETKSNLIKEVTEELKKYYAIKHQEGDSYDDDLVISYQGRKIDLRQGVYFLDISSDDRYFVIRQQYDYEGIARMPVNISPEEMRWTYKMLDLINSSEDEETLIKELEHYLKDCKKILQFANTNKVAGIDNIIVKFMKQILSDTKKVYKRNKIKY